MAKRKKSKKSKKTEAKVQHVLPKGWWEQAVSVIIGITALLLILAMFGMAGPLPAALLSATRSLFGWGAFVVPAVLLILMAQKFLNEDNKLSGSVYIGGVLFVVSLSSFMQLFVDPLTAIETVQDGSGGGMVGQAINTMLLGLLSKVAAGFILFAVMLFALLFILKIPVKEVFKAFFAIFKKEKSDELKVSDEDSAKTELKLNTNVEIETESKTVRPTQSFKNTIVPDKKEESKDALTMASDPEWNLPETKLLSNSQSKADPGNIKNNAQVIKETFNEFKIDVSMEEANVGPRVTQYTFKPPAGVKLAKIATLDKNLELSLAAKSIRVEAPIPGKRAVGVEVPNVKSATVSLRNVLESADWQGSKSKLSFAVGKDISGRPVIGELETMPHLLIAGQTGAGKSVMINTLLSSLLYKNSPADLKLILVDPKQVELRDFNDIPHLLTEVITMPEKTISALKWAVNEMERRYTFLSEKGKKNIQGYNAINKDDRMPYIVIVIDEMADLMMMAAKDVEALIVRIAQKGRAAGIHLVLATQRPSVNVITGLIKANVPSRIAFTVASQIDSRTILDQAGAEKLLGQGDMLMVTPTDPKPKRIQGVFIDDTEVVKVTTFIKDQRAPDYNDEIVAMPVQIGAKGGVVVDHDTGSDDKLFADAVNCIIESGKVSTSFLQRRFRIGYQRAARLVEDMEDRGIIGPADGARPRDILVSSYDEAFGNEGIDESDSVNETEA